MTRRARKSTGDIFNWNRKYLVGIQLVDKQHRKLVDLINNLARKLQDQSEPAALLQVFEELASYAAYHFKAEEGLMQEWHMEPGFEIRHKESHASFIREIGAARLKARIDPREVTTRTLSFLSRWLILHILGTDMRMANEIIALEKGMSPVEARARAAAKMEDTHEVLLQAMGELYETLAERAQDALVANGLLKEEILRHEEAEDQRRMLATAIEHCPVSIFITDREGRFEYVNPKFTALAGYSMADLAGMTPRILKSGAMPEKAYADFWQSISDKGEWFGEFHNRRKDGSLFWAKTSVTPIRNSAGSIRRYLTIQEDVSASKAMEDELKRSHASLVASLTRQRDSLHDLDLLNAASDLLQTCASEEEAGRACALMAEKLGLGTGGSVAVPLPGSTGYRTLGSWGRGGEMQEHFDAGQCWGLRRGMAHEVKSPGSALCCSHFVPDAGRPALCLPLLVRGQAVGLLHVAIDESTDEFDRGRIARMATGLGNALKLVLDNVRLARTTHAPSPPAD